MTAALLAWPLLATSLPVPQGLQSVARAAPLRESARVVVHVQDGDGEPMPARVSVRDANGDPYPGERDPILLSHSALGSYFYTQGTFTMDVVTGPTDIVVGRGCEWVPRRLIVDIRADTTLVIPLERAFDLRSQGWYPGDAHVHTRHYPCDYDIGPEEIHWVARCEDLAQAWCLDQEYEFTGGPHEVSTPETGIYYATEYRNMALGHAALLGLKELVGFFCCWPPDPVCPMLSDIREIWDPQWDEALVLLHPQTGVGFFEDDQWPGIGLGRELPVLAALGYLDALEILVYTNVPDNYVRDWYALLNCGLRVPPSAGSDACLANYNKKPPGGYRVYVREEPGEVHDHVAWIEGHKAGRSFVTNYPLIPSFSVEDVHAGGLLELPGPTADVSVRFRVESVLDVQTARVLRNGAVVGYIPIPPAAPDPVVMDTTITVSLGESSWLAVRVDGETDLRHAANSELFAHTAPVYVHLDDEPVRGTADAGYFLHWLDSLEIFVEARGNWESEEQHEDVLARLEAARQVYGSLFREPPGPFDLLRPLAGDSLDLSDPVLFFWTTAADPELGDRVTYRVELAADSLFTDAWIAAESEGTFVLVDLDLPPQTIFWWRVVARDRGGNETIGDPAAQWFYVVSSAAAVADGGGSGPPELWPTSTGFPRLTVWPNPARDVIRFRITDGGAAEWSVQILDVHGRVVAGDPSGNAAYPGFDRTGPTSFVWNARRSSGEILPSGVYWIRPVASPTSAGRDPTMPDPRPAAVLLLR